MLGNINDGIQLRLAFVEAMGYQRSLQQASWDKGLPVIAVPYGTDKVARAQMVTPHFETGRVRIRGVMENGSLTVHPSLRRFVSEAIDFPYGDHDDCVDAVCGVVQMCVSEEIVGQTLSSSHQPGFALMGGMSGTRRGDPFDVWKSPYHRIRLDEFATLTEFGKNLGRR